MSKRQGPFGPLDAQLQVHLADRLGHLAPVRRGHVGRAQEAGVKIGEPGKEVGELPFPRNRLDLREAPGAFPVVGLYEFIKAIFRFWGEDHFHSSSH